MDGEVIYFDAERGIGFITGRDGNRYVFDRADLTGGERVAKGTRVRFTIAGDRARVIQAIGQQAASVAPAAASAGATRSVPSVSGGSLDAVPEEYIREPGEGLGVLGYFHRCITSGYADFRGRARRKEFWSFALVSMALIVLLISIALAFDFASGNLRSVSVDGDVGTQGAPYATMLVGGLAWLFMIVPSLAVTVRRIHDIGLAGWFILLNFVPSVGSLIILVFTLIPTQRHPNKWGPVPAGVRI